MRVNEISQLSAFVAVAEERRFRRAAARLNLMPSTLSHSLRALETRLGVRLLNRTTRTVGLTEAGDILLQKIAPAFASIGAAVEAVNDFRERPHGTVRISVPHLVARMIVAPIVAPFLEAYPDVVLEVIANDAFVDIVKDGFDAGVRLGESLDQDMTAVPVSPDYQTAIVASPAYLERHGIPASPRDLQAHACILHRQASGTIYRWELERGGQRSVVQVDGRLVVDTIELTVSAAIDGVGIAFVPDVTVTGELQSGRLMRILEDWSPPFPGFYLYYSGRRQTSAALRALVDVLRFGR